jgi:hypothetical protein
VAITWLLRRTGLGTLSSLVLGSALATGALQHLVRPLSISLGRLADKFGLVVSEWRFPDLFALTIYDTRIPRPFITEVLVVLILCVLIGIWTRRGRLDVPAGIGLGVLMSLLAQGDPYSFSTLGLVLLAVVIGHWTGPHRRTFPWPFALAFVGSGLAVGAYFIFQLTTQNPEAAIRFGLAEFPRDKWVPLPGYGPLLRVAVVALFTAALLVVARLAARRAHRDAAGGETETGATPRPSPAESGALPRAQMSRAVAWFGLCLVAAAWFTQPVQLLVLGQGAQIYHYLLFTLPCFYAYALVLLLARVGIHLARPWQRLVAARLKSLLPTWTPTALVGLLLSGEAVLGTQTAREAMSTPKTARNENTPWAREVPHYRAGFRALDAALVRDPVLKAARTFATFNYEINFLLTGFHDKRAYLPDNGFTTLPDRELERRLFEFAKIFQLGAHDRFPSLIENQLVMNYWLGCAKYWFSSEHTFAARTNYNAAQLAELDSSPEQVSFKLALPLTEMLRLARDYEAALFRDSDVSTYPDLIIVSTLVKELDLEPIPFLYTPAYTNDVFWVYRRIKDDGLYSAGPTPTPTR